MKTDQHLGLWRVIRAVAEKVDIMTITSLKAFSRTQIQMPPTTNIIIAENWRNWWRMKGLKSYLLTIIMADTDIIMSTMNTVTSITNLLTAMMKSTTMRRTKRKAEDIIKIEAPSMDTSITTSIIAGMQGTINSASVIVLQTVTTVLNQHHETVGIFASKVIL